MVLVKAKVGIVEQDAREERGYGIMFIRYRYSRCAPLTYYRLGTTCRWRLSSVKCASGLDWTSGTLNITDKIFQNLKKVFQDST